ncbi:type-4 ice-structuring protein LS-12-like [Sphaeramia orbicularis]|uniref:Type-4 ice-structuring protein LS-12-like n=1 Tax=Sphaeramia orbicularis TaxID=375764 RepID=A0A672YEZ1_9TELE|nr:type-4 ice-structuring protein LS-12-like [Sphaeramia orbicularis]
MKFTLIATLVVLALAQGSLAQDATDLEKLTQYFEDMKAKMTEMIRNQDVATQAQALLEQGRTNLEPLTSQVQEQLRTITTKLEEQVKPLAENVQAQMQPMIDQFQQEMQNIFNKVMEQTKAIGN